MDRYVVCIDSLQSYILSTTTETICWVTLTATLMLQSYILSTTTETKRIGGLTGLGHSFNRTSFQQQLKRSLLIRALRFNASFNRTSFQQQLKL